MKKSKYNKASGYFKKLAEIMAKLRGPQGCPWDRRQTHKSLVPYLFSEAEEVRLAVRKKDWKNLEEELGDILLQVVFHSQLAEEAGLFDLAGVVNGLNKKLKRRHPHVFGGKKLKNHKEVIKQWEEIKKLEKQKKVSSS
ncbi:MAG: hypothetical protein A2204_06485 [Elusimicrobia bacterium RIFOXYA1_FULL_47_7]|nr:MAG: hypothetical protein A2278_06000 [Elusimicrobia bacterium RIFOXYA12_FULL_49_49]OGS08003.1 MAG: hypothetical protein A2204_06485 [Elusimicrobia bacterium RIFOXYA1_FULL_47_7]OGS11328.1 MAG: hypothetical protein A2386_08420 [Elusimicrobia bacterium RIFOXYB1_FULL_48_9]OGS16655.1 MAG: hypothetical protein A2251_04735 [Elusimicrobia bacterium RIFOXYA2_FULL_47_53]OGS25504.1 MAG: hypothetical protein A2339_00310 [Elusimicrobia bacterium RIFOXYB12_FULL_50_12]OGS31633.1 MAG: hypothetical protein